MRALLAAVLLLSLAGCGPPGRANDHSAPSGALASRIDASGGLGPSPTGTGTGTGTGNTLLIQPAAQPNGMVGTAYSSTVTCSGNGASAPITWAVSSGSLPPGLALSGSTTTTETISGTPTTAGTYPFGISSTSGPSGAIGMITYTVTIQ